MGVGSEQWCEVFTGNVIILGFRRLQRSLDMQACFSKRALEKPTMEGLLMYLQLREGGGHCIRQEDWNIVKILRYGRRM